MNFRQPGCFREIMTTGTVTGAAKALGISQRSASSLIAELERELGFALFRRPRAAWRQRRRRITCHPM